MFEIEQFVADCRAALADRASGALQEVVARAIADPAALIAVLGAPTQSCSDVLYRGPDLTVLNLVWAPHQWTLPHNHNARAVIGMYGGREDNMFWRRLPEGKRIEAAGAKSLSTGDVAVLGRDIIHSVTNPVGKFSGALHVYDGDFFSPSRSMWDAETLSEEPFDVIKVSPMFHRHPVADVSNRP